jgi:hypothetical protein
LCVVVSIGRCIAIAARFGRIRVGVAIGSRVGWLGLGFGRGLLVLILRLATVRIRGGSIVVVIGIGFGCLRIGTAILVLVVLVLVVEVARQRRGDQPFARLEQEVLVPPRPRVIGELAGLRDHFVATRNIIHIGLPHVDDGVRVARAIDQADLDQLQRGDDAAIGGVALQHLPADREASINPCAHLGDRQRIDDMRADLGDAMVVDLGLDHASGGARLVHLAKRGKASVIG